MSKNRQKLRFWFWGWLLSGMVSFALLAVPSARGDSYTSGVTKRTSPVVILSGEFFRAMEKYANPGTRDADGQEYWLEQIATAQRFAVKTNLTLLEQNEKIIRLLEDLKRQGQGGRR
jgi:hypothetical protein